MLDRIEPIEHDGSANAVSAVANESRNYRISLRDMLFTFSAISVLFGVIVTVGPLAFDRVIFGTGPVWFRPWPTELQSLLDEVPQDVRDEVSAIKAFCLGQPWSGFA